MENKAEVIWQSKETTPDGKSFMTVKKARGYYYYAERGGVDSIAFILFDGERFALINESKPPMDERENKKVRMTTAFGGSVDMDASFEDICKIEVREEAGYDIPLENIKNVGSVLVSTQMSQMCHLFLVNVQGYPKTEIAECEQEISKEQLEKDPEEFAGNSVVWMSKEEVFQNPDWKAITIIAKAGI